MKTVLFALNGSYSHTSLAIRAIGASLMQNGQDVTLIEKNLKDARQSVLAALYEEKADIYGFSVYIWNVTEMLRLASELSLLLPNAAIVFGGPEVSFADDGFFARYPFVDHIIAGEGEDAFPTLCRMLAAGEPAPRILSAAPFSAFEKSGIYYDTVGATPHGLVYYESVRGCPFSCAYCLSSTVKTIRAKPSDKVLSDLLQFEQFDDIRTVKLVDRTFNFDRERAKAIWRALADDMYTKEYHFEVSAALLDAESIAILAHIPKGKFRLEIGVQSTNPKTIQAIERQLDTKKTLQALEALHKTGNLHLHADLIAGLPYEDLRSFAKSFDDVYGKCDVLQLGFLKLLRGSAMRKEAERFGIRYSPEPPYRVLQTADMSFSDLTFLEAVAGMTERFHNSGRFPNTFPFLPSATPSPFGFYQSLYETARAEFGTAEVARLSQADAFFLVLRTAERLGIADQYDVRARLAIDFLLNEKRKLPSFLSEVLLVGSMREELLRRSTNRERANCEVVRCSFLGGEYAVVDRENRQVFA